MVNRVAAHLLVIFACIACTRDVTRAAQDSAGVEFFEAKVRPVLVERCYSCHSATAEKLKAGLRLDTSQGLFKGGESGMPAVVPGKPGESQLITAIGYEEEGLRMPPKAKLPSQQIADIEAWVAMGAPIPSADVAMTQATTAPTSAPAAA